MAEATKAELARRVGVHPSTVGRALATDPNAPAPTNPGQKHLRYNVTAFEAWWPTRRQPGRPTTRECRPLGTD